MKLKRFEKKLVLNKKTVVNLVTGELNKVKGGKPESVVWSHCCVFYSWIVNQLTECTR